MSAAAATGRSKEAPARAEARVIDVEGSGTETAAAPESGAGILDDSVDRPPPRAVARSRDIRNATRPF